VDRVLASEAKGRWFDPSQPHQVISIKSMHYDGFAILIPSLRRCFYSHVSAM
jgi:hypothetical protein